MSDRATADQMLRQFGPPDDWMLSVEDIERIMLTGPCRHLLARVGDCSTCLPSALTARQLSILAERLGCTPEDAAEVGDTLVRQHLEDR